MLDCMPVHFSLRFLPSSSSTGGQKKEKKKKKRHFMIVFVVINNFYLKKKFVGQVFVMHFCAQKLCMFSDASKSRHGVIG